MDVVLFPSVLGVSTVEDVILTRLSIDMQHQHLLLTPFSITHQLREGVFFRYLCIIYLITSLAKGELRWGVYLGRAWCAMATGVTLSPFWCAGRMRD